MDFTDRLETRKVANDRLFNSNVVDKINQNIVFIYTPPKVGSTTLVTSLRISASFKLTVIHIHDEAMLSVLTNINNVTIIDNDCNIINILPHQSIIINENNYEISS